MVVEYLVNIILWIYQSKGWINKAFHERENVNMANLALFDTVLLPIVKVSIQLTSIFFQLIQALHYFGVQWDSGTEGTFIGIYREAVKTFWNAHGVGMVYAYWFVAYTNSDWLLAHNLVSQPAYVYNITLLVLLFQVSLVLLCCMLCTSFCNIGNQ